MARAAVSSIFARVLAGGGGGGFWVDSAWVVFSQNGNDKCQKWQVEKPMHVLVYTCQTFGLFRPSEEKVKNTQHFGYFT
jgi:hypothetical protein